MNAKTDSRVSRNPAIEGLRIMLMLGICMCHSVGAGGFCYAPVRNVCMMCTVGFVFITGWFGVGLAVKKIARLLGIAIFALAVVVIEDVALHGHLTENPLRRMIQWWFLNTYLMLMILSPILNSIVTCVQSDDAKIRRDGWFSVAIIALTIYGVAWPMHCRWIPRIRFFLTIGCPCQFGTMCVIYLLARIVKVTGILDKSGNWIWWVGLAVPVGLAMSSYRFSYYNSPVAFVFAVSVFALCHRIVLRGRLLAKLIAFIAPSMFFVYLYHSHGDPGFVIIKNVETYMVNNGVPIPASWIATAVGIFTIGVAIDLFRRYGLKVFAHTARCILCRGL